VNVTYEQALDSVLPIVRVTETHIVSLASVSGEVLARDVYADRNIPPFPRAAMDGYAVAWTGKEVESSFRVVGTVNPGGTWNGDPADSDCIKIMTGAMVPLPFDTVIQVELAVVEPGGAIRFTESPKRERTSGKVPFSSPRGLSSRRITSPSCRR
jgi:molybdopterin molybdotransferase